MYVMSMIEPLAGQSLGSDSQPSTMLLGYGKPLKYRLPLIVFVFLITASPHNNKMKYYYTF